MPIPDESYNFIGAGPRTWIAAAGPGKVVIENISRAAHATFAVAADAPSSVHVLTLPAFHPYRTGAQAFTVGAGKTLWIKAEQGQPLTLWADAPLVEEASLAEMP